MAVFWATKVVPFEKPDEQFVKDVTLPAFLHAFGHCLTNVSFAAVAVSFTHTVKSAPPRLSARALPAPARAGTSCRFCVPEQPRRPDPKSCTHGHSLPLPHRQRRAQRGQPVGR